MVELAYNERIAPEPFQAPVELNLGLSQADYDLAEYIIDMLTINGQFYGIAGHCIVTGMPRQGKGLFATWLSYNVQKLFKGKHILSDERLKQAFGKYQLFTEDTLHEEIERMTQLVKEQEKGKINDKAIVDRWRTETGEVMLKNSVLRLSEYWRYMYNRRPSSVMNYFISGILRSWGHIDVLVIGDAQLGHDLDAFTCLPYVNYNARCAWSETRPDTVDVHWHKVVYNKNTQSLVSIGKAKHIIVDGGLNRPRLGVYTKENGEPLFIGDNPVYNRYFDLYFSKSPPKLNLGMNMAQAKQKGEVE